MASSTIRTVIKLIVHDYDDETVIEVRVQPAGDPTREVRTTESVVSLGACLEDVIEAAPDLPAWFKD